jgi:hypothetical protein
VKLRIALLVSLLCVLSFSLFSFAPSEKDGRFPSDIFSDNEHSLRPLTEEDILFFGFEEGDFYSLSVRGSFDMAKGLVREFISSGLTVSGFNHVDEYNAEAFAFAFSQKYESLTGVNKDNLKLHRAEQNGNVLYITLWQVHDNIELYDGRLELRVSPDGRVFVMRNRLNPVKHYMGGYTDLNTAVSIAEGFLSHSLNGADIRDKGITVLPVWENGSFTHYAARRFKVMDHSVPALFRFVISKEHGVLRYNEALLTVNGKLEGSMYPRNLATPAEVAPWRNATLYIDSELTRTDDDGYYSAGTGSTSHSFMTSMRGRWVQVKKDSDGSTVSVTRDFTGTNYDFIWSTATARADEMNAYYHTDNVHGFIKNFLRYNGMDRTIQVSVGRVYDNAYFDGTNIVMGAGDSYFYNLALFADIIQHEYQHATTQAIYGSVPGIYEGMGIAMNEAFSDFFPCAQSGEPLIGEGGLYRDGTPYMRTINNSRRYPLTIWAKAIMMVKSCPVPSGDSEACWIIRRLRTPSLTGRALAIPLPLKNILSSFLRQMIRTAISQTEPIMAGIYLTLFMHMVSVPADPQ